MKLLIVLFALLAVVLNIIMPAFGMNPVCNCNECTEPYRIERMKNQLTHFVQNPSPYYPYQSLSVQTVYG